MNGTKHSTASAFTASFLSTHGPEDSETLRLAGRILAATAGVAEPRGNPEPPTSALRRRMLLAAAEVEGVGLFLESEPDLPYATSPPGFAFLALKARQLTGPCFSIAAGLRLATMADPEDRPVAPSDPVAHLQAALRDFAGLLRGVAPRIRQAALHLGPPAEEGSGETFPQWFHGFIDNLLSDTADSIALAESLAEVTEETVGDYDGAEVRERGSRVWAEIDPQAPGAGR